MTKSIHIIGAGISGISTAYSLRSTNIPIHIYDSNPFLGGMATTFRWKDNLLDLGPHKIFTNLEGLQDEILELIGESNLREVPKVSRIYLNGKYLNFPVSIKEVIKALGLKTGISCGVDYGLALLQKMSGSLKEEESYESFIKSRFGKKTFELIFAPYARKLWGEPNELSYLLAKRRVAAPSLLELVKQILFGFKKSGEVINATTFHYPKKGVIQFTEQMAKQLNDNTQIHLGTKIAQLKPSQNGKTIISSIKLENGDEIQVGEEDRIISTVPIPLLSRLLGFKMKRDLKFRDLILIYLEVDRKQVSPDSWIFFPGEEYCFNRIFEQKNFSPEMIPGDKTILCLELTPDSKSPLAQADDQAVVKRAIDDLIKVSLLKNSNEITDSKVVRLKYVYPVYAKDYPEILDECLSFVDHYENLYTLGRSGLFNYIGTADCYHMGKSMAQFIESNNEKEDWKYFRERFDHYIVID